jgi:uncharacterized SAM-dependent methyltransferase
MAFTRKLLPVLVNLPQIADLESIDVVDEFPTASAEILRRWRPDIRFHPRHADYTRAMPASETASFDFYVGSSISQLILQPGETLTAGLARTLNRFADVLPVGSCFLLSYDSCHDPERMRKAYGHPALEAMELTLITRMNKELGLTGVTAADFRVVDTWHPEDHLWKKQVQLARDATATLEGKRLSWPKGQLFWNASCYKPPDAVMTAAIAGTPFRTAWHRAGPNVRLHLLQR